MRWIATTCTSWRFIPRCFSGFIHPGPGICPSTVSPRKVDPNWLSFFTTERASSSQQGGFPWHQPRTLSPATSKTSPPCRGPLPPSSCKPPSGSCSNRRKPARSSVENPMICEQYLVLLAGPCSILFGTYFRVRVERLAFRGLWFPTSYCQAHWG